MLIWSTGFRHHIKYGVTFFRRNDEMKFQNVNRAWRCNRRSSGRFEVGGVMIGVQGRESLFRLNREFAVRGVEFDFLLCTVAPEDYD